MVVAVKFAYPNLEMSGAYDHVADDTGLLKSNYDLSVSLA